jgi:hypothetical protein
MSAVASRLSVWADFARAGFCTGVENGGRNQFVTVELYDSLDKYTQRWPQSIREGLYNSEEQVTMGLTAQRRILTHSEVWHLNSAVVKNNEESYDLPILVNFIKPMPGKIRE